MKDYRAKKLIEFGDQLFSKRSTLMSLWQDLAENFYVERADFTVKRTIGDEFADNLTSSYPLIARRDLGNILSSMLRPRDRKWFHMRTQDDGLQNMDHRWLEWAGELMRRAMYDRVANFVRATKESDHDYAAFGQAVISTEMNWRDMALLYRCWHLRDVVWCESFTGDIDRVDRKWKPTIQQLVDTFGEDKLHQKMKSDFKKDPYREVECRHVVLPSDQYESSYKDDDTDKPKRYRQPFVSVYIDVENCHIIEEAGSWTRIYTIPRWQTVSGSQYSYSPATVAALPDARLYQAMALTLLEAGEKYANPPMVAVKEAIRSDLNLYAGGTTWVSPEYDERLGEVLRPLSQDKSGYSVGLQLHEQIKFAIHEAFFLNKLSLPDTSGRDRVTAYEMQQRTSEYIRGALPILEPVEQDYNGALCEITFETLRRAGAPGSAGAFGAVEDIPPNLRGNDIIFKFESPLHTAEDSLKGQQFMEAIGLISNAMGLDPKAASVMDIKTALRDAMQGMGSPATWLNSEEVVAQLDAQADAMAEAQALLGTLGQGAEVAKMVGEASKNFNEAETAA